MCLPVRSSKPNANGLSRVRRLSTAGECSWRFRQCHPQTEALVACLDAETGKPQWTRRVASTLAGVAEQQNFISHLLLTLGENMVFYIPEFGVVTALNAADGRLLWAVTYPSIPPKASPILEEPRKQGLTPGVFHQGVLYAAPTDSESILAISAKTGVVLWERSIPIHKEQIRHVLGVVKNRLVLSGNNLWILNATTGAILSPAQVPPGFDPEFDGYGRGILAGDSIFWPTRATIEIRNFSGRRTKQPEPHPGGNLAIAGDFLLVAEPRRLVAYSNFAQVRKKQKELISQNPAAAMPRWRLAQVEESAGEFQKALLLYEEAIAKATPADILAGQSLKTLASENRFRLLLRLGNKAMADQSSKQAVAHFREAVAGSPNPLSRASALKLLGTAQVQANQFTEAVQTFQTILNNPALAETPTKDKAEPLGQFAQAQIANLIRKHGRRRVYADFDRLAADKIAAHLKDRDLEGVEHVLQQYPNALVSAETKHQLARLKNEQGDFRQAVLIWRQLLKEPTAAETQRAVLWELASTLERQGDLRPAREIWRQLAREFPSALLPTEEGEQLAKEFVEQHLQTMGYRQLERSAPALPLFRRWERNLKPGSQVVVPQGQPPGPLKACVLIDDRGLICVDTSRGEIRWRKPLNNPVIWASYGPTDLLLGTKNLLLAVALETGQTLWQVPLNDPDEPAPTVRKFQLVADQVLVLRSNQCGSFEIHTGRPIWNFAPLGRLGNIWRADADFTLVQTENPLRVFVLETKTGKQLSEHRPKEPWTSPPVPIQSEHAGNRGFVAAMTNQQIHAFAAYDPQADPKWIYEGPASFANSPPAFWSHGTGLLMQMDGDTLIKLAADSGQTLWFKPLSVFPFPAAANGIILDAPRIYAAENQTLHCWNLKDGRELWKQPLPPAEVWTLKKSGQFLMAAPWHAKSAQSQAIIVRAKTGEPIQQLHVPPEVHELEFRPEGVLVVAKDKLWGWPSQSNPSAEE